MNIQPLKAEKFIKAVLEDIEPYKNGYLYNLVLKDHLEKTEQVNAGYGSWLQGLISYLIDYYQFEKPVRILDFGCGTGELTVLMNALGFQVIGIDIHKRHLELAKILAKENNLSEEIFVLNNKKNNLPFKDKSFDIITMFSVLEHLDDTALRWLLPELNRVCRGVIYILLPNKLKIGDDHTGLRFVPWMPRWLARVYIKIRGCEDRYFLSESKSWDVYYRSFNKIKFLFKENDFDLDFPPDEFIYPPLDKTPNFGTKIIFIGLVWRLMIKLGWLKQTFYPILNLIFIPIKK